MNKSFDAQNSFPALTHEHKVQKEAAVPFSERRRTPRWQAHVPVFVYGHTGNHAPFHEEAYSVIVSDRGALLIMTTPVSVGEKLLLTNKVTQTEMECRVASVGKRDGPSLQVAIEFAELAPQFWRITAPPQRAVPVSIAPTQHRKIP